MTAPPREEGRDSAHPASAKSANAMLGGSRADPQSSSAEPADAPFCASTLEPPSSADEAFMRLALVEAEAAAEAGDVPVGAIIVDVAGAILGRGRNRREAEQDPTAHAEIEALRAAARARNDWHLNGCTVFVTMEPCPMCAGALVNARVARVVYGCADLKAGAVDTVFAIGRDARLNHRFDVSSGVLSEQCADVLKRFFAERRKAGPRYPGAPSKS